jgi:histidinol dehydrogenase
MDIIQWDKLKASDRLQALKRPVAANRAQMRKTVSEMLANIKEKGDRVLFAYTEALDGVKLEKLRVSESEFSDASATVTDDEIRLVKAAIERIQNYHQAFLPEVKIIDTQDGVVCKKLTRPVNAVGLYVPGGSAPLISTLMMLAVPALLAKCPHKVLCTPPNKKGRVHPLLLVAAELCGIKEVYKLGGAQAIAAMAYGSESVRKVNKIYGPGNAWVTEGKVLVSQDPEGAAIDLPAGPSEVLVIADAMANITFVAADLLAQAEHGPDSQVILITNSVQLANDVLSEVERQSKNLSRDNITQQALSHSHIIVVGSIEEAIEINNIYAPEHLILQVENAEEYLPSITAAGAVFIGAWTPEALGDYVTGSNHVLPTYGHAKSYSGLSVEDFMVSISVQMASEKGIQSIGALAMALADIEGLDAHKMAVKLRLEALEVQNVRY